MACFKAILLLKNTKTYKNQSKIFQIKISQYGEESRLLCLLTNSNILLLVKRKMKLVFLNLRNGFANAGIRRLYM